jgi:polyisoprenoid-binding protein YceI
MQTMRWMMIAGLVLALGATGGCNNKVPEGTVKSEVYEDTTPAEAPAEAPAATAAETPAEAPAETPAEAPAEEAAMDAAVAEAPAEAPAEAAPAAASGDVKTYVISPNDDSYLEFTGYKVTGSQAGGFANFSGEVTVTGGDLTTTQVTVEVDLGSVFTKSGTLTETLKGSDFFEVATFPKAKFTSTEIQVDGDGYKVIGDFDLHGHTKKIGFPATITMDGDNLRATAEFSIDRNLWEISYDGVTDDAIRDDVLLNFEILAEPKS